MRLFSSNNEDREKLEMTSIWKYCIINMKFNVFLLKDLSFPTNKSVCDFGQVMLVLLMGYV